MEGKMIANGNQRTIYQQIEVTENHYKQFNLVMQAHM